MKLGEIMKLESKNYDYEIKPNESSYIYRSSNKIVVLFVCLFICLQINRFLKTSFLGRFWCRRDIVFIPTSSTPFSRYSMTTEMASFPTGTRTVVDFLDAATHLYKRICP